MQATQQGRSIYDMLQVTTATKDVCYIDARQRLRTEFLDAQGAKKANDAASIQKQPTMMKEQQAMLDKQ